VGKSAVLDLDEAIAKRRAGELVGVRHRRWKDRGRTHPFWRR
jgi:hypothetical protein